jgi:hypothetical protein
MGAECALHQESVDGNVKLVQPIDVKRAQSQMEQSQTLAPDFPPLQQQSAHSSECCMQIASQWTVSGRLQLIVIVRKYKGVTL